MKKLLTLLLLSMTAYWAIGQDTTSDLLVHYELNGDAVDATGSGLDGTITGATTVAGYDGTTDGALSFDGSDDNVVFGDIALASESFTVSFWVKLPEVAVSTNSYAILSKRSVCTTGNFFDMRYSNSPIYGYNLGFELRSDPNNNTGSVNTLTFTEPNVWTHIAFVKDNSTTTSRAYVNGQLVSEADWANTGTISVDNDADMGIATTPCLSQSTISRFNGSLDEIRVYTRALTETDLQSLSGFTINGTYPLDGATNASLSSGVVINFNKDLDETTVNSTNIVVSGATEGTLSPTFSGGTTDELFIEFADGLPQSDEITVSLSNVKSAGGETLPTTDFTFSTGSINESLIVHYPFDGSTGDASDNAIDPDNVIGTLFTSDRLGAIDSALNFDGSDDYLQLNDNDNFDFGTYQDFTIATWFKVEGGSVTSQEAFFNKFSSNRRIFAGIAAGGNLKFQLSGTYDAVSVLETADTYDDGFWHHAAFVADRNGNLKIYVNGALTDETAAEAFDITNTGQIQIGALNGGTQYFDGSLDEFQVYNRALEDDEISDLAPAYFTPTPSRGFETARTDDNISIEFSKIISAATAITSNFTITGSKSGTISFAISGGDSRVITLDPDTDLQLDETVTVAFTNLQSDQAETIADDSFSFETADVDKGLLGWYPFDGNANNAAGDDFDGTVVGATLVPDEAGNTDAAYSFDGTNYINLGTMDLMKSSFSYGFWVNRDLNDESTVIISQRPSCSASKFNQVTSGYSSTTGKLNVGFTVTRSSYDPKSVSAIVNPGDWTHIMLVADARDNELRAYKNGVLVDTEAVDATYFSSFEETIGIGTGNACINVDGRIRFTGDLDDFRIYQRVVEEEEIKKLSDFRLEAKNIDNEEENVAVAKPLVLDFNETLSQVGSISVSGSTSGTITTDNTLSGDTLTITPQSNWPYGETISVTITDLEADNGETLSLDYEFLTSSLESSLLVHYTFDGDLADSSATELEAILVNGALLGENRLRRDELALQLDGSNDYVRLDSEDPFNFGVHGDITIATWFKTNGGLVTSQKAFFNKFQDSKRIFAGIATGGLLKLQLTYDNGSSTVLQTTDRFDDGFWHHAAFIIDRDGNAQIFVDGSLEDEAAITESGDVNNIGQARIGSLQDNTQFFNGSMDDFRVYNRVLAASEVEGLAPNYFISNPLPGEDAAKLNTNIAIEFGRAISNATAIADNFTITGSTSGNVTFAISGGDSRVITLDPDSDFGIDEEVTVSFENLQTTGGDTVEDDSLKFETSGINKGMIAFYPFDGDADNEVSNEFHGTVGGATLVADRNSNANQAYSLDGSSNTITFGNYEISEESYTIAFWMNVPALTTDVSHRVISKRAVCSTGQFFDIAITNSSTRGGYWVGMELRDDNTNNTTGSVGALIPGADQWVHVTFVKDNNDATSKVYIDGTLTNTGNWTNSATSLNISNTANMGVGTSPCVSGSVPRFKGSIDDIRVYDRDLSAVEVAALPNFTGSRPTIASDIDDQDVDEDSGETVIANLDTVFTATGNVKYSASSDNDNVEAWVDGSELKVEADADYFGEANIEVRAFNGLAGTTEFLLSVLTVNDAPVVESTGDLSLLEDFSGTSEIQFSVSQPDNESDQTITYSISPDPETITFANFNFEESTGLLSVTASSNNSGSQEFTVTANDGETSNATGTTTATVEVESVNDAPAFELSDATLNLAMNFEGTETVELIDLSPSDESETITYSISPTTVSFANISFDTNTGDISITAVTDGLGDQEFTITADDGQSANNEYTATFNLSVIENSAPQLVTPIADASIEEEGSATLSTDITALFTDADGDDLTYSVVSDTSGVVPTISGTSLTVEAAQDYNGIAIITLTASDGSLTEDDEIQVTVTGVNDAPTLANAIADQVTDEDVAFTFTLATDVFEDVDGDDLTLTTSTLPTWLTFEASTGEFSGTPENDDVGSTTITVTASDGSLSVSDEFQITVENINDAPIVSGNTITTDEDVSTSLDLTTIVTDVDGDDLTFSFNGETNDDIVAATLEGNVITIAPVQDQNGQVAIGLMASDGTANTSFSLTVTVNAVNDAPVVGVEIADLTTDEDEAFTLTLDGSEFEDVDGDDLALSVSGNPDWLSFDAATSTFAGTPANSDVGSSTITVNATDGSLSDSQSFIITVANVNDAPTISLNEGISTGEDESISFDLSTIVTDVDGDAITYSFDGTQDESVIVASLEGSVLNIEPVENQNGSTVVSLLASDGQASTSFTLDVNVSAVNDSPEFTLSDESINLEQDFTGTVTLGIMMAAVPSDEAGETVTYTITPNDNSLVGLVVNGTDIEITSISGASGTQEFTIEANDGQSENATFTQTFTVNVNPILGLAETVNLNVYPNPATDFVEVTSNEELSVEIFNLKGEVIKTGRSNQKIRLSEIAQGQYIIRFTTKSGEFGTRTIIKK